MQLFGSSFQWGLIGGNRMETGVFGNYWQPQGYSFSDTF
jgi:hypothetical protein